VTDANLLSGILDPDSLRRTGIGLNPDKARQAFQSLAASSGLDQEEAILGVRRVVNANMLRGIRRATVEKGVDARDCVLVAFGGAGPIHAAELAIELGIKEVLIPPMAGMFSALGILMSDVRLDFGQTLVGKWNTKTRRTTNNILEQFKTVALESFSRQGLDGKAVRFQAVLDMRYEGQGFHLAVVYGGKTDPTDSFHAAFKRRYGYNLEQGPEVEVVTVRLSAVASRGAIDLPEVTASATGGRTRKRDVLLHSGWETTPVYDRSDLGLALHGFGPMVIEDEGCTVFVPPGWAVSTAERSCLRIWMGS
jgi:N-methylhydantoinase A